MNILVFSNSAWDDTKSLGNTISNFFCGDVWKGDVFSNIFLRDANPNNNICKKYYRMTIMDMIKNYFKKEKIGKAFYRENNMLDNNEKKSNREQRYIDLLHKYSLNIAYAIMDFVFRRKKWLNNNFKKYIDETKPDIFFAFLTSVSILKPIIEYIKKNTNAKIVLFIADDVYGDYQKKSIFRRRKLKKEFEEIIALSDKLYGASEELCEEYGKIFKKRIEILYKGCNFNEPVKEKNNDILKFVYAGNLFYGRDEILSKISKAIDKCNKKEKKAILEIYTGATITDELKSKLNIPGSSIIVGKREYEEIKKIESEADYVLHVESFEADNIYYVRYSFSTKIIDCLQSGSCLLGIGPDNVASIKYISKIPGAYVINQIEDIDSKIYNLVNNNNIIQDSKEIRKFAIKNHDIKYNQNKLRNDFIEICNNR